MFKKKKKKRTYWIFFYWHYRFVTDVHDKDKENKEGKTEDVIEEKVLDDDILEVIGEDPSIKKASDLKLHPELASRWKFWLEEGLPKEEREKILLDYTAKPGFEAPKLNATLEASLSQSAKRRDSYRCEAQKALGSSLMVIGAAMSDLLEGEDGVDQLGLLKLLADAGKLIADTYHQQSVWRKAVITPGFSFKAKEVLKKSKADEFLFGKNLVSQLKEAKSIDKLLGDIRPRNEPSTSKNGSRPSGKRPFTDYTGQQSQTRSRIPFKPRQSTYNRRHQTYQQKKSFRQKEGRDPKPSNE